MQEEFCRVLTLPRAHLRNVSLVQCNLRNDFLNKLASLVMSSSSSSSSRCKSTHHIRSLNLSRNSIEDKSLASLANMLKWHEMSAPVSFQSLAQLTLSKCSISSKGVNVLFAAAASSTLHTSLTALDLSFNFLKDEPTVYSLLFFLFRFSFVHFNFFNVFMFF